MPHRFQSTEVELFEFLLEDEFEFNVPASAVWRALTTEIGQWWKAPYTLLSDTTEVRLEPTVGGRFMESCGGEDGALLGLVTEVVTERLIRIRILRPRAGVFPHEVCFTIDRPSEDSSMLKLRHESWLKRGEHAEISKHSILTTWQSVLDDRLRKFLNQSA
ncbi:MAG: SRPBCC domain-containing protein [Planctomycetales bacterium]|nr:SRPBCC domain-containing protein [bacterium]UNM07270.1 MAG: SRPBCC domain-containing protein [Planctomycetales bacterium]